jgi:hypothetical protein
MLAELLELVVAPLYFYALFAEPRAETEAARCVDRLLEVVSRRDGLPDRVTFDSWES